MRSVAAAYVAALLAMLALDTLWIGGVASGFYRARLGSLMAEQPGLGAALAFYLIYAAGIVVLAVVPSRDMAGAAGRGAVLGLAAYAAWDMTNLAVIRGWPVSVSLVDMGWGIVITAAAATGAFLAARWGAAWRISMAGPEREPDSLS